MLTASKYGRFRILVEFIRQIWAHGQLSLNISSVINGLTLNNIHEAKLLMYSMRTYYIYN